MKKLLASIAVCLVIGQGQSFAQRYHDRSWGRYLGAYGCEIKDTHAKQGCSSLHAWHIRYGYYGSTVIARQDVAVAVAADSPTAKGKWRGTLYVDPSATGNQRAALEALFKRELADYFGKDGLTTEVQPVRISSKLEKGIAVYTVRVGTKPLLASANIAPHTKAWWQTRGRQSPVSTDLFYWLPPVPAGDVPPVALERGQYQGQTVANWDKRRYRNWTNAEGTSFLSDFEFRGEVYADKGSK